MKKIISVMLAVLLLISTLALSSCQLSQMFGKDEETTGAEGEVTQAPAGDTAELPEKMDFFSDDFDVAKYITLGNYKGLPVTLEKAELTDEDFEKQIENLLTQSQYYVEITDRAAAEGDTLNIDFAGYLDGVQFQGGTAAGQTISLTENSGYIDGFADGLVGVMPGASVDLNLTFPENYHSADLAGKAVVFKVKVNYIQGELITPELNDEFVKEYTDGEYTDVTAFKEYMRGVILESLETEIQADAMSDMWGTIVSGSEVIEYPQAQVEYYQAALKSQYESQAAYYGMDAATLMAYYGITEESLLETAKNYTKDDLVFAAIVRAEGFEVTDEEYNETLKGYAESAGVSVEEFEEYYDSYYGEGYLAESFLWDDMMLQLFEWAKVTVLE